MFENWKTDLKRNPIDLALDEINPRLVGETQGYEQEKIIEYLLNEKSDDIKNLARNIATKGFIPIDPIVIVNIKGKETVVEGNCRVCACKLLLNPNSAPEKHAPYFKGKAASLSDEIRKSIENIPVALLPSREEARVYIEQRHTGRSINPWDSYAQGRFYHQDIEQGHKIDDLIELYDRPRRDILDAIRTYLIGHLIKNAPWESPFDKRFNADNKSISETANAVIRLLDFSSVRNELKLEFGVNDSGELFSNMDSGEFEKLICAFAADHNFVKGENGKAILTTRSVNTKADAMKYLKEFYGRKANKVKYLSTKPTITKKTKSISSTPLKKPNDQWLISRDLKINTSSIKLTEMIHDGKSLNWRKTKYASSLLLRAILECILRDQLKKHKLYQDLVKEKGPVFGLYDLLTAAKKNKVIFEDDALYATIMTDFGELQSRVKNKLDLVQHGPDYSLDENDIEYFRRKTFPIIRAFIEFAAKK